MLAKMQMEINKRCFAIFILIFLTEIAIGQSPIWHWTKGATGSPCNNEGSAVANDNQGNVFITGAFFPSTTYFNSSPLVTKGGYDIFLSKYDSAGNFKWAKCAGSINTDWGNGVATDSLGNSFVTGYFSDSISFDTFSLVNTGAQDVFVTKYDVNGNVLWAKSANGLYTDISYGITTDRNGNAYIVGEFTSTSLTVGTYTLTSAGHGIFIIKYDRNGNVTWAKGGTASNAGARGISCDKHGNIFITGYASGNLSFGTYTLPNPNGNIFLLKLDTSGNVLWGKTSQNANTAYGFSAAADLNGNCAITGTFMNSTNITFGAYTLTNVNPGTSETFIAKYDGSGNVLWAKSGSSQGDDDGYSVTTDNIGNLYLAGGFDRSNAQFYPINFGSTSIPFPAGGKDPAFIVKFDSVGNVLCATSLKSGGDDVIAITADKFGNAYIGGDYFISPFIVGGDTLFLSNANDEQIFISKYNCSTGQTFIKSDELLTVSLYPNPASTSSILSVDKELNGATLIIVNSLGSKVKELKNVSGKTITIDRKLLSNGLYFLKLTENEKIIATARLIFQD
jgi:hypothetical protein